MSLNAAFVRFYLVQNVAGGQEVSLRAENWLRPKRKTDTSKAKVERELAGEEVEDVPPDLEYDEPPAGDTEGNSYNEARLKSLT